MDFNGCNGAGAIGSVQIFARFSVASSLAAVAPQLPQSAKDYLKYNNKDNSYVPEHGVSNWVHVVYSLWFLLFRLMSTSPLEFIGSYPYPEQDKYQHRHQRCQGNCLQHRFRGNSLCWSNCNRQHRHQSGPKILLGIRFITGGT